MQTPGSSGTPPATLPTVAAPTDSTATAAAPITVPPPAAAAVSATVGAAPDPASSAPPTFQPAAQNSYTPPARDTFAGYQQPSSTGYAAPGPSPAAPSDRVAPLGPPPGRYDAAPYGAAPTYGTAAPFRRRALDGDGIAPVGGDPGRAPGTYEIQPNDSYYIISQKVYGTPGYFRALAELNRGKAASPDRLSPGLTIATPPAAQLEQAYPDLCPKPSHRDAAHGRPATVSPVAFSGGGRTYVVQEGDTLSSIAHNELGKVSRWAEIYELNREALGKEYDYLTPGMRLVMPSKDAQSPVRMAKEPGGNYLR